MATWNPLANDIFLRAAEIDLPDDRRAFLNEACGGPGELYAQVEALLEASQHAGRFLESVAPGLAATALQSPIAEHAGTVIGPYKLLEQIGEGGFGVVFMAEQTRPVQRKVALKVVKPGMDTRQVIARFEAERQALALMDHPNIARVLDAGTTETGRPYFVMDLVRGVPITEYCDSHRLSIRERLELFVTVCRAVQHAHQKGIIHRDIKPTNVLVTQQDGKPLAKVIDFGIAKATGQKLTDKTLFTGFEQLIGTPLYMSPEQAEMSAVDVDTRSDIYSLGVLLYELLTGATPFDNERFKSAAFDELRRIIREEEPPRPSTRVSTLAQQTISTVSTQRSADPRHLSQSFRGELDWVAMKCLEKDRARRYDTASALAADVEHYLQDEPVEACPPSAGYRVRKFVRRNKTGLALASVIGLALLLAIGGTAWIVGDRAMRNAVLKQQVERALDDVERLYQSDKVSEALSAITHAEGILASDGGTDELRQDVSRWRSDLETVKRLEQIRFRESPPSKEPNKLELQRARVSSFDVKKLHTSNSDSKSLHTWSNSIVWREYSAVFQRYGLDLDAMEIESAADRIRNSPIKRSLIVALDDWYLATIRPMLSTKPLTAKTGSEKLLQISKLVDPNPWSNRVRDAVHSSDRSNLSRLAHEENVGEQPPATVLLLAAALMQRADVDSLADAEGLLRQAQRRIPNDFWINYELANCLSEEGVADTASFSRAAVALRPASIEARLDLSSFLIDQGNFGEAEAVCREGVRLWPREYLFYLYLGYALLPQQRFAEAESAYRQVLELKPHDGTVCFHLGLSLAGQGRYSEAVDAYHETIRLGKHLTWMMPYFASALLEQSRTTANSRDWDEAAAKFSQGIDRFDEAGLSASRMHFFIAVAQWDELFTRLVRLRPNETDLWAGRGIYHARRSEWAQAAEDYAKFCDGRPTNFHTADYAGVLLLSGNRAAYEKLCKQLVDNYDDHWVDIAQICAMGPTDAADPAVVLQWAKHAADPAMVLEKAPNITMSSDHPMRSHILALAQFRAGELDAAIESAKRSNGVRWIGQEQAINLLLLAILHDRIGNKEESRRYAELTKRSLAKVKPGDPMNTWIFLNLLLREADGIFPESPIAHLIPHDSQHESEPLKSQKESSPINK